MNDEIDDIVDRFVEIFSDEKLMSDYEELLYNLEAWSNKLITEGPEATGNVREDMLSFLVIPEDTKNAFIGDDKVYKSTYAIDQESTLG